MNKTLHGNILVNGSFIEAEIEFSDKIHSIKKLGPVNSKLSKIIPGFIDLHVHGGGGADIMENGNAAETISRTHARFGTTSFLATTMTAPFIDLEKSFLAMKKTFSSRGKKEARLLGVHLEGPFISSQKLGAQPDFARAATLKEIEKLNMIVPIKTLTLAPEVFNHMDIIKDLSAMNIMVQIGHTNGSYEDGVKALALGAKSFTHLFNAMSTFHHREPGMVGAALAHANHAELIPDLLHVHPGAIKAALRSIPNLYFVTDATSATGMPDGDYKLGSHIVHKCLGGVRLKDGTLAGSALTMDQALRNLISLGLSIAEASKRLSQIPAELIGLNDRGIIKEQNYSDLLVLNDDLTLKEIYIEGEMI
ncbi:MAG: N-acetylglucosamine-6-phosphate deacetylase [Bacteriovorax sp.]|nr:N-acetylglucosamine-6-phosphate deacetylase [Bacteriovorax sp.]